MRLQAACRRRELVDPAAQLAGAGLDHRQRRAKGMVDRGHQAFTQAGRSVGRPWIGM
jgi:hypothetical protein